MSKRGKRIRQAFDPLALKRICGATSFDSYADFVQLKGKDRFYYYKDNGSNILATAHLDSVQDDSTCEVLEAAAGPIVLSPVLDDRLGAYVILELLPKLGITVDWLLTTDEESCQSTAQDFTTEKEYQWMFSFDRAGTDVVMYDYETPALRKLVKESGASVGTGSISDISYLEDLGCKGFNWGVGYQNYHSKRAYAWLNDTFEMVGHFLKFYEANKDVTLPHAKSDKTYSKYTGGWSRGDYDWSDYPAKGDSEAWIKYLEDKYPDSAVKAKTDGLDDLRSKYTFEDPDEPQLMDDCPECFVPLTEGMCADCGKDWWTIGKYTPHLVTAEDEALTG